MNLKAEIKQINTLLKFYFLILKIKRKINKSKVKKSFLLPNEMSLHHILLVMPLYLSILYRGYDIEIFLPIKSIKVLPIYFFLGIRKFHFISSFNLNKSNNFVLKENYPDLRCDFENIIEAHLRSHYKIESTKILSNNVFIKNKLRKKIDSILLNWQKINFDNIHGVFFTDCIYFPQGPILLFMKAFYKDLKLYSYNIGHTSSSYVVNNISHDGLSRHPYSPKQSLYKKHFQNYPPKDYLKLVKEISNRLHQYYEKEEWFSIVATSSYQDGSKLKFKKGSRKVFSIFPHIYWDSSVIWGEDIFKDYREWFEESVNYLLYNTNSIIIIKDHPANLAKSLNKNLIYTSPIKEFINTKEKKYKDRIIYLEPSTKISALNVINYSDCILTVRGTIGIESSVLGIPTICAGTGRYNFYGFGKFPTNKNEYFKLIQRIIKGSKLINNEERFRASLYLKILWDEMTSYSNFLDINHSLKSKKKIYVNCKDFSDKKILNQIDVLSKKLF